MAPDERAWTPAEQTRALIRIESKVDGLAHALPQTYVPTAVWEQRNRHVDTVLRGLGREIGDLRGDLRSKRMPWPAVVSAIVAMTALGLTIVQAIR